MTVSAAGFLVRASRSITSATDLGASTADVMLATVVGLRGHDHPAGADRSDSRQLARLYPSLLGSGVEGEPTIADLMADDVIEPLVEHESALGDTLPDLPASSYPPGAVELPAPRPKRHQPHRRAMTLRLQPEMWRRLRQAAIDNDTHSTDLIRAALERHLAYLDGQKRRAAAS